MEMSLVTHSITLSNNEQFSVSSRKGDQTLNLTVPNSIEYSLTADTALEFAAVLIAHAERLSQTPDSPRLLINQCGLGSLN